MEARSYRQSLNGPQGSRNDCRAQHLLCQLEYKETRESYNSLFQKESLLLTVLLVTLGAFTPTLEAVDGGGQEEAGHDGYHGHRDAREDNDEQVCQSQAGLALPEAVFGQLGKRDTPAVHGQRALHSLHSCSPQNR